MTESKFILTSNRMYLSIFDRLEIKQFILFPNSVTIPETSKVFADIFEALFGAVFIEGGFPACISLFTKIVTINKSLILNIARTHKAACKAIDYICSSSTPLTRLCFTPHPVGKHPLTIQELKAIFPYDFKPSDLAYFKQALTHSSISADSSYERLEFIGDIIVKIAVSIHLYFCFPSANESGLSIVASEIKSNDFLGRMSFKIGLDKLLLANDPMKEKMIITEKNVDDPLISIPKIYGDIVESTLAALTITKGLTVAVAFFKDHIIGKTWSNRASSPIMHPKGKFLNLMTAKFPNCKVEFNEWIDDQRYLVAISYNGIRFPIIGEATDKTKATISVCLKALELIENDSKFLDGINEKSKQPKQEIFDFISFN